MFEKEKGERGENESSHGQPGETQQEAGERFIYLFLGRLRQPAPVPALLLLLPPPFRHLKSVFFTEKNPNSEVFLPLKTLGATSPLASCPCG